MPQEQTQDVLTIASLTRKLDVTLVTVNNWRKGSAERPPLPSTVRPHGHARRVSIYRGDLQDWLASNRPDLLPRLEDCAA